MCEEFLSHFFSTRPSQEKALAKRISISLSLSLLLENNKSTMTTNNVVAARERSINFTVLCISSCLFLFTSTLSPRCLCAATDTLSTNQTLVPGDTLISRQGKFELGFFSPAGNNAGGGGDSYVAIWYKNIPKKTVVWVANRDNPIPSSQNTALKISQDGFLTLTFNSKRFKISNSSGATSAVILDSGNLVLRNAAGVATWQSFDHLTDIWLPGASIGFGSSPTTESKLISWKSPTDPSTGFFSLRLSRDEQILAVNVSSSSPTWRSGILPAAGTFAYPSGQSIFSFTRVPRDFADGGVYLTFNNVSGDSPEPRIEIGFNGMLTFYAWSTERQVWVLFFVQPSDECTTYGRCGANALCRIANAPLCACLAGFSPRDERAWESLDFSGGCVRSSALQCNDDDRYGYLRVSDVKLPANPEAMEVRNNRICEFSCSDNCTCQAYAYDREGTCLLFMGDILDMMNAPVNTTSNAGTELFIKVNAAANSVKGKRRLQLLPPVIISPIAALAMTICAFRVCYLRRKSRINKASSRAYQDLLLVDFSSNESENGRVASKKPREKNSYELPIFSFSSVAMATNNFSVKNKLGEGGFGPVYKGELGNGRFVAIKRLSRRSGQGLEEFKTEMELIAKLQHRNLVGILGCCIENDEKILIYEYMENKSLDFFLFAEKKNSLKAIERFESSVKADSERKAQVNWARRAQIIEGVAQGLLYLHHYSRLRIVHRDLKASNILLDEDMNPKISDFGMARIFGGNSSQANTKRIVGTFGYMSPEYAMHGIFSVKSDVYAFGVLMLEIISGRKNTGFYGSEHLSLLGYAWNLWEDGRILELIDPTIDDRSSSSDSIITMRRCIQIGLLCVQENASERPLISDVAAMLSNEQMEVAAPKHPAFAVGRLLLGSEENRICSVNELTLTSMEPR